MSKNKISPLEFIWKFLGLLVLVAITWHLFWEIIHPVLMNLSPIFAYDPDGRVGRVPDSPAQVALFATFLVVLYMCFSVHTLVTDGIDEFIGVLKFPFFILIIIPTSIFILIPLSAIKEFLLRNIGEDKE